MKKIAIQILSVSFFFLFFVGISSCRKTTKQQISRQNAQSSHTIAFDSLIFDQKIPLIEGQKSPINTLSIHFVYPSSFDGDSTLLKNVQQIFVKALFGQKYADLTPKQAVDSFYIQYKNEYRATATDYNKAKSEGYEMSTWGDAYQKMEIDTVASKTGIVSFRVQINTYNGGAHGSHQIKYFNIDQKTGKLLAEQDIFNTGFEKKLTQAIIQQLLEDNKLTLPEQLVEKGFLDLRNLKSNGNFLLKKDSIMYVFNEYEVASYSTGLVKVTIPTSKISDILK